MNGDMTSIYPSVTNNVAWGDATTTLPYTPWHGTSDFFHVHNEKSSWTLDEFKKLILKRHYASKTEKEKFDKNLAFMVKFTEDMLDDVQNIKRMGVFWSSNADNAKKDQQTQQYPDGYIYEDKDGNPYTLSSAPSVDMLNNRDFSGDQLFRESIKKPMVEKIIGWTLEKGVINLDTRSDDVKKNNAIRDLVNTRQLFMDAQKMVEELAIVSEDIMNL